MTAAANSHESAVSGRLPSADSRKKFDTLDAEFAALTFKAAGLVDARDAGDTCAVEKLETVRARLSAVKTELRRRDPSFDRWECR